MACMKMYEEKSRLQNQVSIQKRYLESPATCVEDFEKKISVFSVFLKYFMKKSIPFQVLLEKFY